MIISLLLILAPSSKAQRKTKVILERANDLKYDKRIGENIQRLIGDVVLRQDSTWFYCDSAYLNTKENNFDAFGNVKINVNDTLDIYGDVLNYDGKTRIAIMHHNVKLVDNRATLTTDHLKYNRNTGIAYYKTGGRIVSEENVLTSVIGHYYTGSKEFFFKTNVVLTNPDYIMHSDTLVYNTNTDISYFYGPTTITGKENVIYCEDGWYNTILDISQVKKNACITHNEQTMFGDSIYYDRNRKYGEAFENITIIDTLQDIIVKGNYAEIDRLNGYGYVTDSTLAIMIDKTDSLFIHSDTLKFVMDSAGEVRKIFAYYKVKIFRQDIQGMCDSMTYVVADSTISLYYDPVIWSDENQLTSDTIKIVYANKEIDTMVLYNSCFIVSRDDISTYNQIKGKIMVAYFKDNRIYKITVSGNSQTIYFIREEDGSLIGVNKAISSKMLIFIENNEIKTITYINRPDAVLYPENELAPQDLILKGFKWIGDKRPLTKNDIFFW